MTFESDIAIQVVTEAQAKAKDTVKGRPCSYAHCMMLYLEISRLLDGGWAAGALPNSALLVSGSYQLLGLLKLPLNSACRAMYKKYTFVQKASASSFTCVCSCCL